MQKVNCADKKRKGIIHAPPGICQVEVRPVWKRVSWSRTLPGVRGRSIPARDLSSGMICWSTISIFCMIHPVRDIKMEAASPVRQPPIPNMLIESHFKRSVHTQFLQLISCFLVDDPILQNRESQAIMKIQKRSESNVLGNLPNLQKERLRKCRNPTIP